MTEDRSQTAARSPLDSQNDSRTASPPSDPVQERALLEAAVGHHLAGRLDQAEALYRRLLAVQPEGHEAHNNLGHLLGQRGPHKAQEALWHLTRAVSLRPDYAIGRLNLGAALLEREQTVAALAELDQALALAPDLYMAHNNRGTALRRLSRHKEAVVAYRAALRIKPDHAAAHNNLGLCLRDLGQTAAALRCFEEALRLRPDYAEARCNLAGPLLEQGRVDEALTAYRQSIATMPQLTEAHTGLLHALHYSDGISPDEIYNAHSRYGALTPAAGHLPQSDEVRDLDPERPLRIGYVSPDLRTHSVAYFIAPILRTHRRAQVEVFGYGSVARPDAMTRHLSTLCDGWRDVYALSDEELAAQVQRDGIDILVDLAGHTTGNRLGAFSLRPAPLQVTYLGYPDTTGLCNMDYRLTDALCDPPGAESRHTERLVRLPQGFLCYGPPDDAPEVSPLPAGADGSITFASFNNLPKVSASTLSCWAAILNIVPGARLLLKSAGFADEETRVLIEGRLLDAGIDLSQVELRPLVPGIGAHLSQYHEADIALDTFPYNGTTTTCEALWMGLPVVSLAGQAHAGRVGVSLLTRVGLNDLVVRTQEEYVQTAVRLAKERARLSALRQGLRRRLQGSPLCDAVHFTASLEDAYRQMWRRHCAAVPRRTASPFSIPPR